MDGRVIIQAINTTGGTLTYSNLNITIGPSATVTVPTPTIPSFCLDPNVHSDIVLNNLQISDSVTTYVGDAALQFLQRALAVLILINTIPASATITAQDVGSTSTTMFNGQNFITGTPTASSTASFLLVNSGSVSVQITGTWAGKLVPEVSLDGGTTWTATAGQQTGITDFISSVTNNAIFTVNVVGNTQFRIRSTASMTGTATINTILSDAVAELNSGVFNGAVIDRSGSATAASTQVMAANPNRKYLMIQNLGNAPIYFNFTSAATVGSGSFELSQFASFVMESGFVSTEAVNIIRSGGSNMIFTAKEG